MTHAAPTPPARHFAMAMSCAGLVIIFALTAFWLIRPDSKTNPNSGVHLGPPLVVTATPFTSTDSTPPVGPTVSSSGSALLTASIPLFPLPTYTVKPGDGGLTVAGQLNYNGLPTVYYINGQQVTNLLPGMVISIVNGKMQVIQCPPASAIC